MFVCVDGMDARSLLVKPRLIKAISIDGFIKGITVLNSELFVIRYWVSSYQVNVYNTNNFTCKNRPVCVG